MNQLNEPVLFEKDNHVRNTIALLCSVFIHLLFFALIIYGIKQNPVKIVTSDGGTQDSVKITLAPPSTAPPTNLQEQAPKSPSNEPHTLTTEESKSISVPTPKTPTKEIAPNRAKDFEKFLPKSNPEYLQRLREGGSYNPKDITGDGGDIPFRGTERRRDVPMIVDRFEHKELSLFQFSQMFHDRFGSVWNAVERWVPPESSLRPGDVVYYKIFINPDGTLDHFENLTNKIKPTLPTEPLDKIFAEVIAQTLPMSLPSKLEKNTQVTEIIAIQIVNRTLFMNFGGS